MGKTITRREFIKTSMAGAGLAIAVSLTPCGCRLLSAGEAEREAKAFSPNVWLKIGSDNIVSVIVNKSEMGQGVFTALPMIVADELDADWKQIHAEFAPAADKYKDPAWGRQSTGGSSSVSHMYEPLRKAGASARQMLLAAAAKTWGVPVSECNAKKGTVLHEKTERTLTYGELTVKAAGLAVPQNPPLKDKDLFTYIGTPLPRLDIDAKVNGVARFGIDTQVPGMLYAAIARPHAYGSKAVAFNQDAAMKIKGVRNVVALQTGIAVCAETPDAAWEGTAALKAKWDKGAEPGLDTESLRKRFLADLDREGLSARNDGDAKAALARAAKKVEAVYALPYLSHTTMEPMNCTVRIGPDACELWVPTQNQTGVLALAQKETGLKPGQIRVNTTYLGGGYGRRFETDSVEEALKIAKAVKKPVKLIWKREEDMQHDFYRPANCSQVEGGLDEKGRLVAWAHTIVCPSIFARAFPDRVKDGIDPAAVEGLKNLEYEVPNISVRYVRIDTPVPVGFWRSVGSSHNGFTVESFADEMAHAAGKDPLEFRVNLLKNHPRPRRVLEVAAEKAGWSRPLSGGAEGKGIAQVFSFGTYVAQVAEVSVDREDGIIRVHRVVCAVDCGDVVNPAIITAQMEGGILMGLSAAMKEAIAFKDGGVATSNFDTYPLLRISEAPKIEVHILESGEKLGGIGEPGLPPIAPAVANAVFNAAGIRLRMLPMTPTTVSEAMKKA
ncbi:MAG: xanthine dehydrogenase family protein molybdopterin-binding subunit [Nitrospirae bacterium]|nr:xanthine dehydrogenase family protein molybdopterin-binding subunit [Nitrospirota bacterium]